MKKVLSTLLVTAVSSNVLAAGRDHIEIVGFSTVYPFATVVAETFGKKLNSKRQRLSQRGLVVN